jgi:hypothetical protein
MKQYKNTVQTIQNTGNTSTHITKTPTQYYQNTHTVLPKRSHNAWVFQEIRSQLI